MLSGNYQSAIKDTLFILKSRKLDIRTEPFFVNRMPFAKKSNNKRGRAANSAIKYVDR